MSEIIAYCGLDCSKCDAFTATQAQDLDRKKQIAERWTKGLGIEFKPGDTECMGCVSDRISGWCTKVCKIRPCGNQQSENLCSLCRLSMCEVERIPVR